MKILVELMHVGKHLNRKKQKQVFEHDTIAENNNEYFTSPHPKLFNNLRRGHDLVGHVVFDTVNIV